MYDRPFQAQVSHRTHGGMVSNGGKKFNLSIFYANRSREQIMYASDNFCLQWCNVLLHVTNENYVFSELKTDRIHHTSYI